MSRLAEISVVIESEPLSGQENMQRDEALLERAIVAGLGALRWYRWLRPTISLGYFQPDDALADRAELRDWDRVRRLTGGGAILHQHEWTYSIALPAQQRLIVQPQELYDLAHGVIAAVLNRRGFPVERRNVTQKLSREPDLCFLRADEHDLHCCGHKILGSAQRRRKGAILQHGSLVLKHPDGILELPGLLDLVPSGNAVELVEHLAGQLGESLAETRIDQSV